MVSGLLTQTLEKLVRQEDAYIRAERRHLRRLEQGLERLPEHSGIAGVLPNISVSKI